MRLMGATTKKETVNAALRDHVARIKRLDPRGAGRAWRVWRVRAGRGGA
jgi:Arc/MetJ family transcription regulator